MIPFLLVLLIVAVLLDWIPVPSWTNRSLVILAATAALLWFVLSDETIMLAAALLSFLGPWLLMKHVPKRRLIYFTGLGILIVGHGSHMIWVIANDGDGSFSDSFGRALLFLLITASGFFLFNLLAFILWLVYRKKNGEGRRA